MDEAPTAVRRVRIGRFGRIGLAALASVLVVTVAVWPRPVSGGTGPTVSATLATSGTPGTSSSTPQALRWRSVPSLLSARTKPAVGCLGGRFYVVGGEPVCPPNASCVAALQDGAWFDPRTESWGRIADAPVAIAETEGVAVGDELYFVMAKGAAPVRRSVVVAYAPATDSWRRLPEVPASSALIAAGDELLAVGQCTRFGGPGGVRSFRASVGWTELPDDPLDATICHSLVYTDGWLLASTGMDGRGELAEFEIAGGSWTGSSAVDGLVGTPVAAGSRVVWLDGLGRSTGVRLGPVYDPVARTWTRVALDLQPGPFAGDGVVVGNRVVYEGHLLDPATMGTVLLPALPGGNTDGQTVAGGPDGLLVLAAPSGTDAWKFPLAADHLPVS